MTLKSYRVNKKLTQEQASEILGISVQSLVHYEKGTRQIPLDIILKMLKLYEVRFDDVFLDGNYV